MGSWLWPEVAASAGPWHSWASFCSSSSLVATGALLPRPRRAGTGEGSTAAGWLGLGLALGMVLELGLTLGVGLVVGLGLTLGVGLVVGLALTLGLVLGLVLGLGLGVAEGVG